MIKNGTPQEIGLHSPMGCALAVRLTGWSDLARAVYARDGLTVQDLALGMLSVGETSNTQFT